MAKIENYSGSIELISGLKQKNNNDFPLMEANAIQVDANGKRLDAALAELADQGFTEEDIENVFAHQTFTELSTKVSSNSESINSINTNLDEINETLKDFKGDNVNLGLEFDTETSTLYLFEGEEINTDPETGNVITQATVTGGSGAVSAYKVKVIDNNNMPDIQVLRGRQVELDYTVELYENDELVTSGASVSLYLYIDDELKSTSSVNIGQNKIDITEYLKLGKTNIRLTAAYTDADTQVTVKGSRRWTVSSIEMYMTSSFDDSTAKTSGVNIPYTLYGAVNKTVYFLLDGEEYKTIEYTANQIGTAYSIALPLQSHGGHSFEMYCTSTIQDELIESEHLYFDILFVHENNSTPAIRIKQSTSVKPAQYSAVPLEYTVYSTTSTKNSINLFTADYNKETGELSNKVIVSTLEVDRSEQEWNYKPNDFGLKAVGVECGDVSRYLILDVEKFAYDISPELVGLELDFSPEGRSNNDFNYDQFINNAPAPSGVYDWTVSDNFDWVNGGWKIDENGDNYFCIKAGTSVDFNYKLFNDEFTVYGANKAQGNGKEFKMIFKTTNVANPTTTFLSCLAAGEGSKIIGLEMKPHHAYISSTADILEIPYSEEDIIEFDFNIIPFGANGEIDGKNIPMVMPYEDGTPCKPILLKNTGISFKQIEAVPVTIGSSDCDVHIYRIKAYKNFLSDKAILNNFIADARSGEEKANRFLRNLIYNEYNQLTPESVAEACPHLRVYKIAAPRFTRDKGDKVPNTTIEQIYKNGDPLLDNWVATNCIHNGQGTSSNQYGYSGRNLEYNMKVKPSISVRITITSESGVYDEEGTYYPLNSVLTEKIPLYTSADAETREEITDLATVATIEETEVPGTVITLGDKSTTTKKISLTRNSVETNYLNLKVNIASSENANNALLQKRYDRYLPYISLAKQKDPKVKNTMEFFNCVVFIAETDPDISTHQEFGDTDYHFYAIGNIGDSKKTDDTRVNVKDDPKEFTVEIMDWNLYLSSFPKDTMTSANAIYKEDSITHEKIYTFLKDSNLGANGILFEKQADGNYVHSLDTTIDTSKTYYVDILENDDFSEDYTYGFRYLQNEDDPECVANAKKTWVDFYRFITEDLPSPNSESVEDQEKIANWKTRFEDWFILDAAFYYYLFTLRYTMVDNRAKNSFWHYGQCIDGKYRFDFWDYDNDTALGIDNAGKLVMDYGIEDSDLDEDNKGYFRAHDSLFFTRVRDYFSSELMNFYRTIEQNNINTFSSNSLITEWDTWQDEFPEELWRLDYERKYKRTYVGGEGADWDNALADRDQDGNIVKTATFLEDMMNGKKKYQRRQFERNQDFYMSSMFASTSNYNDLITLRATNPIIEDEDLKPSSELTIVPYLNMYINLYKSAGISYYRNRCYAGQSYTIPKDKYGGVADFIYVSGGSRISSLGDISKLYLQQGMFGVGSKLKELTVGNNDERYENTSLNTLDIGASNKILEKLDVRNISSLTGDLPITDIPSLKKLYAQGTSITGVIFADNGLIEEAYLPETLNTLIANNLYYLKTLSAESYENLSRLAISNCPAIDTLSIAQQATKLERVRLTNINWTLENTKLLNRLLKCTGLDEDNTTALPQSVLTGSVYVENIRQSELDAYNKAWPNLTVSYQLKVPQFKVTFNNEDGSFLGTALVDQGSICPDPLKISSSETAVFEPSMLPWETPKKESTAQYDYIYSKWDVDLPNTVINSDITVTAQYTEQTRSYTVTWYAANGTTPVYSVTTEYGTGVDYPTDLLGVPKKEAANNIYYLFDHWDISTMNIVEDTHVKPVFVSANPYTITATSSEVLTPVELYAVARVDNPAYGLDKYFTSTESVNVQFGYMPTYDEIEENILISVPQEFNGEDYFNSNINLLDMDRSFTFAIDYEMYNNINSAVLFSCYNAAQTRGIRVNVTTSGGNKVLQLQYNNENHVLYQHPLSDDKTYRDILVIRHKAGNPALYIYTNDRYTIVPIAENILGSSIAAFRPVANIPLTIAAAVSTSGTVSNNASCKIHYAKLWFEDVGASEAKQISKWVYETKEFEFAGKNKYLLVGSDSDYSRATFVGKYLLDEAMAFKAASTEGGWFTSAIKQWMDVKLAKAVDPKWSQIIEKSNVTSMYGYTTQDFNGDGTVDKSDYEMIVENLEYSDNGELLNPEDASVFYLPTATEILGRSYSAFAGEPYINEINGSNKDPFPGYTNKESCKKYTADGVARRYWLRTPNISSKARYQMFISNSWSANDTPYNTIGQLTDTNTYLLPCFSI